MKVTQWFSASVKPVHVGTYQVKFDSCRPDSNIDTRYWDGAYWRISRDEARSAFGLYPVGREVWRGLANKQKAKK